MSHAPALAPFAVKSYRYLRWSIVVVVLSILAAVFIEWLRTGCFEGSISAYYYTPAQAVFVGGLVAIGVCLIAIKGSTDREDVLLNLAGVLAPIVAFVPTGPPKDGCSPTKVIATDSELYIDNNILAYAIGGLAALVIGFAVSKAMHKPTIGEIDRRSGSVLAGGVAILAVGLVGYLGFRKTFLDRAHFGAAFSMFSIVAVVIFLNARHRKRKGKSWVLYMCIAAAMPIAGGALAAVKFIEKDWDHFVLWLELVELLAFGMYWVVQTFEHWNGGVPTGADRELARQ